MNSDPRTIVLEYARLAFEEELKQDESQVPGAVPRKERMKQIMNELGATHEEILLQASDILMPTE